MRTVLVLLVAWSTTAHARDAHVTATTRTTIYIDAGTADGLAAGARWQATIGGRSVALSVAAVATHDALLAIDGAAPAIGTVIALARPHAAGAASAATAADRDARVAR